MDLSGRVAVVIGGTSGIGRTLAIGLAEADKIRATGLAQAEATAKQVEAFGGPEYQLNSQVLMRFAQAIENGKLPLVPNIVLGGDGKSGSGSLVEAMLAMMLAQKTSSEKLAVLQ